MQGAERSGRPLQIVLLSVIPLMLPAALFAQLAAPNAAGLRMGHVHLNVSDIDAQRKFWVEQFDGAPITRGGLDGVVVRGMMILFTKRAPLQGSEGTVLDHFGFKVRSRDEMVRKARADGFAVPREFKGSEGFPNAYITGPDGVKVELQEDPSLLGRAVVQHFHFLLPDPGQLRNWYVAQFSLEATTRGPYQSADIPGVNLTFAPNRADVGKSMRGGIIDHFGFEVRNLQAFCQQLEAQGVKFESPYHKLPGLNVASAMLVDPNGVYLELTEGLAAYEPARQETSGVPGTSK